jgi:hypothetical protein
MICMPRIHRRRATPLLCLVGAVMLSFGALAHFSGGKPATTADGNRDRAGVSAAASRKSSGVTPISHEIEEGQEGCILTASATDSNSALVPAGSNDERDSQSADQRFERAIVGKWEDDYRGKRHLTVNDDGTGKMVVEPDGLGRALFADRLSFDIEWSISEGRVTMRMLGGEPESKVNLILKLHGREAEYKILNLDDGQMLLLDSDGKTQYDWRRPAEGEK